MPQQQKPLIIYCRTRECWTDTEWFHSVRRMGDTALWSSFQKQVFQGSELANFQLHQYPDLESPPMPFQRGHRSKRFCSGHLGLWLHCSHIPQEASHSGCRGNGGSPASVALSRMRQAHSQGPSGYKSQAPGPSYSASVYVDSQRPGCQRRLFSHGG